MRYYNFLFSFLRSTFLKSFFSLLLLLAFWSNIAKAITLATSADFEPFEFIQDGKMVGIDIDLVEELKKETGLQIDIVEVPFDTLFEKLEKGEFDGIIAGVNITSERKTKFDFTQEYSSLEGGVAIALKKDSPYLSAFNSAISKLKANGTLQYIEAKYSK